MSIVDEKFPPVVKVERFQFDSQYTRIVEGVIEKVEYLAASTIYC